MRTALAVLIAACVLPRSAHAGRTFYGWLYGTEVMPERGVELQTWIQEENDKYGTRTTQSSLWWGPLIGVTDQLELALPLELEWSDIELPTDPPTSRTSFTFKRFGVEARYRLVPPDTVDASGLVPLVRFAIKRDVTERNKVQFEGDFVASYEIGIVHALIDIGAVSDLASGLRHFELRPGGGVSIAATGELRVGGEIYSELSLDSHAESWVFAGPDLSWTHGRFWFSGVFGIGLYHVGIAPRVMWGIAF